MTLLESRLYSWDYFDQHTTAKGNADVGEPFRSFVQDFVHLNTCCIHILQGAERSDRVFIVYDV